jgi:nicotinamidase-related amidase
VAFSKVNFRAGYRDVADSNKAFALIKMKNLFPPGTSKLISILQPGHDEIVVDKDRFCAFSGNDLKEVLRSAGIKHLVMAGVATSGVILSTFTLAADEDYSITILSDACADPKPYQAPTGLYADTAEEAQAAVNRYADLGYVQIKVYSSLNPEFVPGIARAAHARGLRVSGHIPNGMIASQFVEAGAAKYNTSTLFS